MGNRNNLLAVSTDRYNSHIPEEVLLEKADMSSLRDGTGDAMPKAEEIEPIVQYEATAKEESGTEEPPSILASPKVVGKTGEHGQGNLDIVVPIPESKPIVGHEVGHEKEEAIIVDEAATGPPILIESEEDNVQDVEHTVKDVKHEEPDLNGRADLVPETDTKEAAEQHQNEVAIKDEDTSAGHPIVIADGKGDAKAIKEPEPVSRDSHTDGAPMHRPQVSVGPQQPEEDLGGDAAVSPGELLKTPTSEPDYNVISRSEARTPDLARVAAEVADSAATLDRETPTPEVDDEEAGRIGLRRMSTTPMPEVAETAAEVADSAAIVDREEDEVKNKEAYRDGFKADVKEEMKDKKEPVSHRSPRISEIY